VSPVKYELGFYIPEDGILPTRVCIEMSIYHFHESSAFPISALASCGSLCCSVTCAQSADAKFRCCLSLRSPPKVPRRREDLSCGPAKNDVILQVCGDGTITLLDVTNRLALYLKQDVSENEFCTRLQVEHTLLDPIDRASL
jgi:hypothetical protein